MKQLYTVLLLLFSTGLMQAQSLRGVVRAADTNEPLTGATLSLYAGKAGATPVTLASNPEGVFEFDNLRPGYYRCEVALQGFETTYFNEILIAAGKDQVLEFSLRRTASTLPEVTIAASVPGRRAMQPLSEIPLTRDQTLRLPAMYFDPARLAAAYPGVAQTDDGTNHMSIRGNSPAYVRWRLEGLDIVNPNHLPNAGTFTDAPATGGGGVLMFSAQMIDNASLLTGAFPAGYGDAVGGVMDMNLRAGNKRQHEFTAQAGLIGLDLAAEGPLGKKNGQSSYLFNYRYSTVGLLGQLGVSFGDEQINFQDLSFHIHSSGKNGAQYSLFGLGGLSANQFSRKADSTEIKYDKDFYNIDFSSATGVAGGSARWRIGQKAWLKTALVYSRQENDWSKDNPVQLDTFSSWDRRVEERFSGSIELRVSAKQSQWYFGAQTTRIYFRGDVFQVVILGPPTWSFFYPYNTSNAYWNSQPYARWEWTSANGRFATQLGSQIHYNTVYRKAAPTLRGAISYKPAAAHKLVLSAGMYKQDAPVWTQFVTGRFGSFIGSYRPPYISSNQAGLRYIYTPNNQWRFSVEGFLQHTSDIPHYSQANASLYNNPEAIHEFPLSSDSEVQNTGLEFSAERFLQNGWFVLANATVFDSKYRVQNGEWLDSRWDIGRLSNLTFGKEWVREKSASLTRTIGVGARGVWTGGIREADIDLGASVANNRTVYNETLGYYRDYPDYLRFDIRVYWKKSLGDRRNSTFALDIQNVTGRQNLAYHFYDPYTRNIENKFQLGPIPNFSWKVEF